MSIEKYADFNGSEVEVIQYAKGWYQILLADGSTKKVRKADLSNMRDTSNLDGAASFTIKGEGSTDAELVTGDTVSAAQAAVAEALAEQGQFVAADNVTTREDKNHPADRYDDEFKTFICGECECEFMTADSLAAHKAEEHDAPIVAPRPGSLAASLLGRDKTREASIELCQKSASKAAKQPKIAKVHPLRTRECPECGKPTTHGTNDDGIDYNACDECDWQYVASPAAKPKLEPKLELYTVGKGTTESGRPTIDRDDAVANALRSMPLNDIYAYVARVMEALEVDTIGSGSRRMETGEADFRARYSHLNPGMQRMNLGNVLRGVLNRLGLNEVPKV